MFSLDEIAHVVHGRLRGAREATPRRVVHDSRLVEPGDLFVALRGARTDGHAYLIDAYTRGACGAIVSDQSELPASVAGLIVVPDPLAALQALAAAWRSLSTATIVGVTGSNGKTTTRRLLAHLLQGTFTVHEPPENYNTEIGLPLALLGMPEDCTVGVFELATESPGEIGQLAKILRPPMALVTSAGPSHLDGLGSIDAVAVEKWSLVESLPPDGVAFVNAESEPLRAFIERAPCEVVTIGLTRGDLRGHVASSIPRLVVQVEDPPLTLETGLLGDQNATNVLLAAACALRLGLSPHAIEERAATFEPIGRRLRPIPAPFGTVLDDTYNANPASTKAALRVLAQFGRPQSRRIFAFGDMLGLGEGSDRYHEEVLDLALNLGLDVAPVGPRASAACAASGSDRIIKIGSEGAVAAIRDRLSGPDVVVLVKGSRALELERIVAALLESD